MNENEIYGSEREKSEETPKTTEQPSEEYEEFDISEFDFTIHDPGEDLPVENRTEPEREPPKETESEKTDSEGASSEARLGIFPSDRQKIRTKAKRYLRYALRPMGLYENVWESVWPLFLLGTCLFGGGFYLLVGMDWLHAELITFGRMCLFITAGMLVGGIAALTFSGGAVLLGRLCKSDGISPFRMISAAAGAAVLPCTVLLFGLLLGLFGASVSMSFGVIALLWWIFTLMEVLRDLLGDRYHLILTFITLWGTGLFALISLTFTLK